MANEFNVGDKVRGDWKSDDGTEVLSVTGEVTEVLGDEAYYRVRVISVIEDTLAYLEDEDVVAEGEYTMWLAEELTRLG